MSKYPSSGYRLPLFIMPASGVKPANMSEAEKYRERYWNMAAGRDQDDYGYADYSHDADSDAPPPPIDPGLYAITDMCV